MQEIASLIQNYFCDGKTGRVQSGIVYCLSQRDCDDTAEKLSSLVRGLTVKPYHAGLDNRVRAQTQQEWIQDKVRHGPGVFTSFDKVNLSEVKPNTQTNINTDGTVCIYSSVSKNLQKEKY